MELDERLHWFGTRVTSSLKPRAEELKNLFSNEESRRSLLEFCNNEEVRHLYISFSGENNKNLVASFKASATLNQKTLLFIKFQNAAKITRDNINNDVFHCSTSTNTIQYLEIVTKEVFLPLLSIEQTGGVSADKMMDVIHRLLSCLQIASGSINGEVKLPLPSIEVLSEAAGYGHRKLAVIHILETFLIGWIKQIKIALKLEPELVIARHHGAKPGPLCEADAWSRHLEKIHSLNEQLCSPVIVNILTNLEEANSTYAQSFHNVKREIAKAEMEADENLQFLSTVSFWFQALSSTSEPSDLIPNFAPLMHTLFLIWQHSRYYHKPNNLTRLLKMVANEVVRRAKILVGDEVLGDLINAYSHLKEALQICASFRGRYLDTKENADALNQQKLEEQIGRRTGSAGIVWHSRLFKESRTPRGGNLFSKDKDQKSEHALTELAWDNSPWPARNSPVFGGLNSFMERCNDVLELVETTRDFRMLRHAAEVGGAGGRGLDAMVREIHEEFESAMKAFKMKVKELLNIDETQHFERGFFIFRSVIRELETRLGGVLKESFKQCWDIRSKLRLLEVFQGTSSRELVQVEIDDTVSNFVFDLTSDVMETRNMFKEGIKVTHAHIPPLANELLWLHSLKARLKVPIEKLKLASPASLKGDDGWKLRDMYSDLVKDIDKAEAVLFKRWQSNIGDDLRLGLKKSLLTCSISDDGFEILHVNMDDNLEEILKEVQYLQRPPFELRLPDSIRSLIRNTDPSVLRTNAARLETVVSEYNAILRTISDIEKPLFEAKINAMEHLLKRGLYSCAWKDVESSDFIEQATNLVCNDVYRNVETVRNNFNAICKISESWSTGTLDAFGSVDHSVSFYINELNAKERSCCEVLWNSVELGGAQIHQLLQSTFEAVKISRASPAWQAYAQHISNIVYEGLRKSILISLNSMLQRISLSPDAEPILAIRLELIASEITFSPPLHPTSAAHSLKEYVADWLQWYLSRASYVAAISSDENFMEMASMDAEVVEVSSKINHVVEARIAECETYLETFKEFAFLWLQDVKLTFDEFLKGNISSRAKSSSRQEEVKSSLSTSSRKDKERSSSRASSAVTTLTSVAFGTVALTERTMAGVKRLKLSNDDNAPSLDDFDKEIDVYRNSRDEIHAAVESVQAGWIRVNMQPIKKTIETYASKWVFTFTRYLSDQVSSTLSDLDAFLKRIEPGVEAITGEERDIDSFMRLMRIFNEVTAQQSELDTKFATMKRTIALLEKYEQKLPDTTQKFYSAAPIRWNNLKMKVNQAKQRLGPRIQAEADNVTETLHNFGERCKELDYEFRSSEAFNRACLIYTAHSIMDSVERRLCVIESEAHDLVELQELLEKEVVDFSILPSLRMDLGILRNVWDTVKIIQEHQNDWKRHRWQRIRPKLLRKLLVQQQDLVKQLPDKAFGWDVTIGVSLTIEDMMSCIPIMEDLSKAAMRTRHWKQLVRATGGAVNISSLGLTKMTLGQFLQLGLQNHADEVRGVIQRSAKDVGIEKTLKLYEEVWLSKTFELSKHSRLSRLTVNSMPTQETPASEYGNESELGGPVTRRSGSRVSLASMGLKSDSRMRLASLSNTSVQQASLTSMTEELGDVYLLKNIEPILEELELHQMSLQSMFGGSAASSFIDEIVKWQKTLQNLEAVLLLWWEVQRKWVKLDDVYNGNDCRVGLPKETNIFSYSSYDFRELLKVTEKNPNVLQICSKENIYARLEKMNLNFETCLKALVNHLDRRRQRFPRLYLVSSDDVLDIVCGGYDPGQISPHLSKILHNACLLDYDVQESEERSIYRITGVRSLHGEVLKFVKPVECDAVVETWLSSVINTIKSTLQVGLASALGMPLPDSLKFASKSPSETTSLVKSASKRTRSEATQRKVLFASPETEIEKELDDTAHVEINLPASWSLRNVNEVAILALQIELTKKFEKSFEELRDGNKTALDDLRIHLSTIVQSAAKVLQGAGSHDPLHEVIDDTDEAVKKDASLSTVSDKDERVASKERRRSEILIQPRMVLLPSQIQKLTNLVFILSSKRDLAARLSQFVKSIDENENEERKKLQDSFEWRSQIKYYWSEVNAGCKVTVMDHDCDYGFEYQGTAARMITTPESDKAFFWLCNGFSSNMSGLIVGPSLAGKKETVCELSNAFGYPLFSFLCSEKLTTRRIGEIFKGIAATGSWGLFCSLDQLSNSAMSVAGQLMSAVSESLQSKKSSAYIQDEEQTLSPSAKIFATLHLNTRVDNTTAQRTFPTVTSSLFSLPGQLLEKFRTVCISKPDVSTILGLHLIINGFKHAQDLAGKLASIYSMWSTLSPRGEPASIKAICNIIADAGDHRDKLSLGPKSHADVAVIYDREGEDESEQGSMSPIGSITQSEEQKDIATKGPIGEKSQSPSVLSDASFIADERKGYLEEKSILLAVRGSISPSLCGADAIMFATMLSDFFPSMDVPLVFDDDVTEMQSSGLSIGDDTIGLSLKNEVGAPLTSLPRSPQTKDNAVDDLESAIRIAVDRLKLQPGSSFVGRVFQLAQLTATQKMVLVVGPSGSGKTECIRTLVAAQREMGRNVMYDSVFLGTAESEDLFGYIDAKSGLFKDGLLPSILRKKLHELCKNEFNMSSNDNKDMRWIHLDGKADSSQMDLLSSTLSGNDTVILPSSERLHLPTAVRFIWEVDSLDNINPLIIRNSGILKLSPSDVGWELIAQNWLAKYPSRQKHCLSELCTRYIHPTIDFLLNERVHQTETEHKKSVIFYNHPCGQLQHVVNLSNLVLVKNLFSIFEALISNAQDPVIENFENYFNFSCFWAFGANLVRKHREHFSHWWREKWSSFVAFPSDVSIWECQVHPETHEFVHVSEIYQLPSYSGNPNTVFPADAHVATVQNMVLSHLVGVLAESGKPTLLIGPTGSGKSHLIRERLMNNSSEMAEVQSLFINANKFMTSTTLWQRLNDYLEWKHTRMYVPKGNKKLICLIDDLNHSYTSSVGNQSACEMMRQVLDHRGSFYYDNWKWREIHDVSYLATYNPWTTVSTPQLSSRLLSKWVVIYHPFPSREEQYDIYGSLLTTYFLAPNGSQSGQTPQADDIISSEALRKQKAEKDMKQLLESIVFVTVEVQDNLRRMFLPTPDRCHYIFTLNNLNMIFKNLCLAVKPQCKENYLLMLWKHECQNIHGSLLFDKVDKDRWIQLLHTSARKRFNKSQMEALSQSTVLASTVMDLDESVKKSGSKKPSSASSASSSSSALSSIQSTPSTSSSSLSPSTSSINVDEHIRGPQSARDICKTTALLQHNINEYNKDNPRVKIYLYDSTVKVICRLTRILRSPHECGNCLILADGFPGLPLSLIKVAAYTCGFTMYQIQPSAVTLGETYTTQHFKADMVNAYTTAGLKGEKLVFVLNEMELLSDDFLVYVAEFLVSNSISHIFNDEEHTSIINAIRTEVTQAGLNYSKETAWNFFLRTVRENLRFIFITSSLDQKFQLRCRESPAMFNAMQTITMPLWSKEELVQCTMFHLKDLKIFDEKEKENVAHLLASMHLSLNEAAQSEAMSVVLNNTTNTSYERFVEHFIDLALKRSVQIQKEYGTISKTLEAIQRGTEQSRQLKYQLEHETLVLEQKKQGNYTLLGEIGMDKAITEEQLGLVGKQQWKIQKLEKLLPRYQDAHERAVFKAAAIVKETKQVLADLDHQGLSDLRGMQKPDNDIEDVLAAVIIIVKSPTSDLTWNKGAKRIMANLERFREEIAAFDEVELTESTLQVVEPYTKRPHFAPGCMEKKTGNSALESLVLWCRGVVKYHRMMLSRVKPLHIKVEQTTKALEEAVEKLGGMENKLKNLDYRMKSLSGKFEDASVDKSRQGLLTEDQKTQLKKAAYFEKLLARGTEQWMNILNSISKRKKSMVGSVAISAGFATYLGSYHYGFRRKMIETLWPDCLKERGIVIDISIGKSLTVDITMSVASNHSQHVLRQDGETTETDATSQDVGDTNYREDDNTLPEEVEAKASLSNDDDDRGNPQLLSANEAGGDANEGDANEAGGDATTSMSVSSFGEVDEQTKQRLQHVQNVIDNKEDSDINAYDNYCIAVLQMLTGQELQQNLVTKGVIHRQLEDVSIIASSTQTPLLIIDPYDVAIKLLTLIKSDIVTVDISQKETVTLAAIEKCITSGDTAVIYNIEDRVDSCLFSIITHINTKCRLRKDKEPSVIKLNGRRLLIQPTFQLILIHKSQFPVLPHELASTTTVVDLRPHNDGILHYFQLRGLQRIMPELYTKSNKAYFDLFRCFGLLERLDSTCMSMIRGKQGSSLWGETELITTVVKQRTEMTTRFAVMLSNMELLRQHRAAFAPLANCVLSAFSTLQSLAALRHEYQFSVSFMVSLFDLAVGGRSVEIAPEHIYDAGQNTELDSSAATSKDKESIESLNRTELLGVNIDQIKKILTADNKELVNHRDNSNDSFVIDDYGDGVCFALPHKAPQEIPPVEREFHEGMPSINREFFSMFHKHISKALNYDHQDLFAALCWLRFKSVEFNAPKSDLVELLLSKHEPMPDPSVQTVDKPEWLTDMCWNRLLSCAKQCTAVNRVLRSMRKHGEEWRQWYESTVPETMPLPVKEDGEEEDHKDARSENEEERREDDVEKLVEEEEHHGMTGDDRPGSMKGKGQKESTQDDVVFDREVLKLLTIKCLRADRFKKAFLDISLARIASSQQHLARDLDFDEALSYRNTPSPVLILLHSSSKTTDAKCALYKNSSSCIAEMLSKKAQEKNINLIRKAVFDGNEQLVDLSVNNAVSTESWVLIENLHLADAKWLHQFAKRVARLQIQADSSEHWRIFMTTEESEKIPLQLLNISEKISFDMFTAVMKPSQLTSDGNNNDIKDNVTAAIKSTDIWLSVKDESLLYRNLLYLLCVVHGLIISRLKYVPKTFTQHGPVNFNDLASAIDCVKQLSANGNESNDTSLRRVCSVICDNIYCSKLTSDSDKQYIEMLFNCVVKGLASTHGSTVELESWSIAIPPTNVDPMEYANWFVDKLEADDGPSCTLNALGLKERVYREFDEQRSNDFVDTLRHMYQASRRELFSKKPTFATELDAFKIRQAISRCKEDLPPLLKIDKNFGMTHSQIRLNPQLRSLTPLSEKSVHLNRNEELASSLSFCLLKECQNFNALLYEISSCIEELDKKLVSGINAVPVSMGDVLECLHSNRVPLKWQNKTTQKSLTQWIEGLSEAYDQLNRLIKRGSVPQPNAEPTIGYGLPDAIDLSLLVNPEALVASMRYAKALSQDVNIDQVVFKCYVSKGYNRKPMLPSGVDMNDGIIIKNLYLDGATWDTNKGCLVDSRNSIEKLPPIFLTTDISLDLESGVKDAGYYGCPVYENGSQQKIVFILPLPMEDNENERSCISSHACIMLEPSPVGC